MKRALHTMAQFVPAIFSVRGLLFLVVCLLSNTIKAQDPHFSQSPMSPVQLNPALTAASEWDVRVGGQWKEQWSSVPVSYRTFAAFYDQRLHQLKLPLGQLGVGGSFLYDQAGDSKLSWTQAGLRVSYGVPLEEGVDLRAGFGIDIGQRAFLPDQLEFGDQYNGELFDPGQASAEQFARQTSNLTSLSAGLAVVYRSPRNRTQLQGGLAASHLNSPSVRFYQASDVQIPIWARFHANAVVEVNDDWDATGVHHFYRQGNYQEILVGLGGRYHLAYKNEDLALGAGVAYRLGDAIIPQLEALYGQWRFGLSYDINTSAFQTATNGRGGLELALHYYILQPKPPEEFKSCPIF
ncbi:MAG: PorP/SprF family type IX secretion system membrane protein [Bacteroidota bacterium]